VSLWSTHVVPVLVEKACRSRAILEERTRWIPHAHGDVLEVGIGSGLNLAFYGAEVTHVTGIDPSPQLLAKARTRIGHTPVELVEASAEQLQFDARSFDSAVVTYSLCSIPDPARALAEVRRVLRPGGELVFVEHGLAPEPRVQRWQRRLTPVWRRVGGGCHLDRDIAALLRSAEFDITDHTAAYTQGASWLSFTYQGVART
jgi:ubiquinone/menaquinone biosynthesis C-methylase UbiE